LCDENRIHHRAILPEALFRSGDLWGLRVRKFLWARVENKSLDELLGVSAHRPAHALLQAEC
jgi:hypothetical protein